MIEAVNSAVVNSSALRVAAEVISSARVAADVAPVAQVSEDAVLELPKAPYISPYIVIDRNYNKAVLQIRDSETGDVVQQFPTESRLAQISRVQAKIQQRIDLRLPDQVERAKPAAQQPARSDIVSVQEVTATQPANAPSQAIAAFSAGAQAGQTVQAAQVSVIA